MSRAAQEVRRGAPPVVATVSGASPSRAASSATDAYRLSGPPARLGRRSADVRRTPCAPECRGALLAPRGWVHHQRGRPGLEPRHKGGKRRRIVGHRPAFARGPQGDIAWGFRNSKPHQERREDRTTPHWPSLAACGRCDAGPRFGRCERGRDDPSSAPLSADLRLNGLACPGQRASPTFLSQETRLYAVGCTPLLGSARIVGTVSTHRLQRLLTTVQWICALM
jgi:hypothetical protein